MLQTYKKLVLHPGIVYGIGIELHPGIVHGIAYELNDGLSQLHYGQNQSSCRHDTEAWLHYRFEKMNFLEKEIRHV